MGSKVKDFRGLPVRKQVEGLLRSQDSAKTALFDADNVEIAREILSQSMLESQVYSCSDWCTSVEKEGKRIAAFLERLPRKVRNACISYIQFPYWKTVSGAEVLENFDWTPARVRSLVKAQEYDMTLPSVLLKFLSPEEVEKLDVRAQEDLIKHALYLLRMRFNSLIIGENRLSFQISGVVTPEELDQPALVQFLRSNVRRVYALDCAISQIKGLGGHEISPVWAKYVQWLFPLSSLGANDMSSISWWWIRVSGIPFSQWPAEFKTVDVLRKAWAQGPGVYLHHHENPIKDALLYCGCTVPFLTKEMAEAYLKLVWQGTIDTYIERQYITGGPRFAQEFLTYRPDFPRLATALRNIIPAQFLQDKTWLEEMKISLSFLLAPDLYPEDYEKHFGEWANQCSEMPLSVDSLRTACSVFLARYTSNTDGSCKFSRSFDMPAILSSPTAKQMVSEVHKVCPTDGNSSATQRQDKAGLKALLTFIGLTTEQQQAMPFYQQVVAVPFATLACMETDVLGGSLYTRFMERITQVKGWRDACRYVPLNVSWRIFDARQQNKEITPALICFAGVRGRPYQSEGLAPFLINPWAKFPYQTYNALLKYAGTSVEATRISVAISQGAAMVALLFGNDAGAALRFVEANSSAKHKAPRRIHDAMLAIDTAAMTGRFSFRFSRIESYVYDKFWADFCLKFKGAAKYTGTYQDMKRFGIFPKSLQQVRRYSQEQEMGDVPPQFKGFRDYCIDVGATASQLKEAISMAGTRKTHAMLPDISLSNEEGDTMTLLPIGDLRALVIGEESGCCQSLGGVGEDAAIHSFTNADSGVYQFRSPSGTLLAQAWVWADCLETSLVFDSIESRFDDKGTVARVAQLMQEFAKALKNGSCGKFQQCLIGDTGYGMTKAIVRRLKQNKVAQLVAEATPTSCTSLEYSDAEAGCFKVIVK